MTTSFHYSANTSNGVNNKCRICGTEGETIEHIISSCTVLAQCNNIKRQMECRISGFTVSETTAKVPLGNLLDHTVRRIVQLQNSVIEQYLNNKNLTFCEATLVLSYGFDGSSGFSNYNQKFTSNDNERNDSSI
jgi:hypothetical protein